MKTANKILASFFALMIVFSLGQTTWAQEDLYLDDNPTLMYELTSRAKVEIRAGSARELSIILQCSGKNGTTGINANTRLEQYNNGVWKRTTINGATALINSTATVSLYKTITAKVAPGTYRAVVTFTVSASGRTETVTVTSKSITVK